MLGRGWCRGFCCDLGSRKQDIFRVAQRTLFLRDQGEGDATVAVQSGPSAGCVRAVCAPCHGGRPAGGVTVDQAVKLAVANNRMLKITALQLADTKEDYLAFKTHRYPTFNTYIFASELLAPISFTVPAGQFGTYPGDRADSGDKHSDYDSATAHCLCDGQRVAATADAVQNQHRDCGKRAVGGHGGPAVGGKRQAVVANVRETYYTALQLEDAISATRQASSNTRSWSGFRRSIWQSRWC